MSELLFMALWSWFLVFGPIPGSHCDCRAPGPILWRNVMSEEQKEDPVILERATQATTRPVTVPLNEFVLKPELYCHRDDGDLEEDSLKSMMESLVLEGMHSPVEFFKDGDGKPVLIRGHRRIKASGFLVQRNTPGFSSGMPIEAVEVFNATPQDLLCRSVSDNANREDNTLIARIKIAKKMHDQKVESNRAAHAMKYSVKQFSRDLRIAQNQWMLNHVEREDIASTQAADLLEAAAKANRLDDLKDHMGRWVEAKKIELKEKELLRTGKPAKDNKKVKSELSKKLTDHWLGLLSKKLPLDDMLVADPETVIVGIDADANKVTFNDTEIDLAKIPLGSLAKSLTQLDGAKKVMLSYLKTRYAVEGARGPQDVARQESQQLDMALLRAEGLDELADELSGAQGSANETGQVE